MLRRESARHRMSAVPRRDFMFLGAGLAGGVAAGLGGGFLLFSPETPKPRMFGVSMTDAVPGSVSVAENIGIALDRKPQVLNFFMAWQWRMPFPVATLDSIRNAGAIPEITWEPWDPRNGVVQPAYQLDRLGDYDDYVDAFIRSAVDYQHEIHLRFAHEMNSDWYPWSVSANNGSPAAYIDAHRRLYDKFNSAGARNVRWVWCPNVIYGKRPDLLAHSYPGDDYVDVVALDGYNSGGTSADTLFAESLKLMRDVAPKKPIWLNEVGCTDIPDKAGWISNLFAFLRTTDVECLVWFELDHPNYPDWTLLSTPESAAAARRSLESW